MNADLGVEKEKKRNDYGEVGEMIYGEEGKRNTTVVQPSLEGFLFFIPKIHLGCLYGAKRKIKTHHLCFDRVKI